MQRVQPIAQAAHVAHASQIGISHHFDGHTLLQRIQPIAGERIDNLRVLLAQLPCPPLVHCLERGVWQLARRVVPRVQRERGW